MLHIVPYVVRLIRCWPMGEVGQSPVASRQSVGQSVSQPQHGINFPNGPRGLNPRNERQCQVLERAGMHQGRSGLVCTEPTVQHKTKKGMNQSGGFVSLVRGSAPLLALSYAPISASSYWLLCFVVGTHVVLCNSPKLVPGWCSD